MFCNVGFFVIILMRCSICNESFNSGSRLPKLLPCGHTFCLNCIPAITLNQIIICPEENFEFFIAPEELKTNFIVVDSLQSEIYLKCCNGHALEPLHLGPAMKCDKCYKSSTEYLNCPLCIYIVCYKCFNWISNTKELTTPGLLCHNGHSLRITENIEEFYKAIRKKRPEKYLCDGCKKKKKGVSGHCRECKVDYCEECIGKLQKILICIEKIECGKSLNKKVGMASWFLGRVEECSNQLAWRYGVGLFKCSRCKEKYNKSGSFLCKDCDVKYCIGCTYGKLTKKS